MQLLFNNGCNACHTGTSRLEPLLTIPATSQHRYVWCNNHQPYWHVHGTADLLLLLLLLLHCREVLKPQPLIAYTDNGKSVMKHCIVGR
jgi:hypothetical protein